ncbi:MAG: hypothetical protein IRZ13_21390 [Acetobacteraceae bacterium]|nr:hypothetical protein [Acetobacteraceae bacterium]
MVYDFAELVIALSVVVGANPAGTRYLYDFPPGQKVHGLRRPLVHDVGIRLLAQKEKQLGEVRCTNAREPLLHLQFVQDRKIFATRPPG